MTPVAHMMLKSGRPEGGIETFVEQAFLASGSKRFRHVAYCLRGVPAASRNLRQAPLGWAHLPDWFGKLLFTPWALWRARWIDRVAIVHFHGFGASVWAPLAKAMGLRVVAHSHGIEWERARWTGKQRGLLYAIAKITCRWSDCTLVVSRKEANIYAELLGAACAVVPGGFDSGAPAADCASPRDKAIVVAGRPVPEKRIAEVVEAWNAIRDHRGYVMRVFCAGQYGGAYPERIRRACAHGRDVKASGFVGRDEFVAALQRSSYFLAISSLEGRSLAMLEALATGNVLIVASTPENAEFVPREGNRFIPPDAEASTIARTLQEIVDGPPPSAEQRERNCRAGRARSWLDVRRECERIYAEL